MEDGFECIGPQLVGWGFEMETIGRQVWEEVAGGIGEGVLDIEELDGESLGGELVDEIGELLIDLEDGRFELSVLGAGEHGGENEVGVG